jgi:hypothetical protein
MVPSLAWLLIGKAPTTLPGRSESVFRPEHLYIFAGILFLIFLMQFFGRRRRKPKPTTGLGMHEKPRASLLAERQGIQSDMQELLVELQELSRAINSQIDTKFSKLEASIRNADERIERLERLIRQATGVKGIDVTVGGTPDPEARTPQDPAVGPNKALIYSLADAGKTPVEIARETGVNTGEVELILALRP